MFFNSSLLAQNEWNDGAHDGDGVSIELDCPVNVVEVLVIIRLLFHVSSGKEGLINKQQNDLKEKHTDQNPGLSFSSEEVDDNK